MIRKRVGGNDSIPVHLYKVKFQLLDNTIESNYNAVQGLNKFWEIPGILGPAILINKRLVKGTDRLCKVV